MTHFDGAASAPLARVREAALQSDGARTARVRPAGSVPTGTATRREQVLLPRAPRERLDGGLVGVEAEERRLA